MNEQTVRTKMLLGDDALQELANSHVAVFGIGGVGSYCAEALARAGVGQLTLIDDDTVSVSNLNRQLVALHSTIGKAKTDVMAQRIHDIAPDCKVNVLTKRYTPEDRDGFFSPTPDYIADCIDSVSCKTDLIATALKNEISIISAMGTGNKLDPSALYVTDISKTQGCPLARVMRKELRKRDIHHLKVVCSSEEPRTPLERAQAEAPAQIDTRPGSSARRDTPGSLPFVPAAAGLLLAATVVRDLIGE